MRKNRIISFISVALILGVSAFSASYAQDALPVDKACGKIENKSNEINGWCLSVDRRKGNCLACHVMVTPRWPEGFPEGGNTAPPLVAMKARFPDRAKLTAQIEDARDNNENSMMPPFKTHGVLNDKQISDIIDFLYTL